MNNTPWYVSSTGKGLSLTIKGILVGLIPIILILAKTLFDIDLDELELMNIIEGISAIFAGVIVVFGLIRKIYLKFTKK